MRRLVSVLLIVCLSAACGGPAPAATPASTAPAPAATSGPAATPQVKGQDCGTVLMLGSNAPRDASALQAETCFARAYQQCSTATLVVRMMGVDAGVVHTLVIESVSGKCTVTDNSLTYNVSLKSEVNKSATCASVEQSAAGLLIKACGDSGDLSVPAPQS